MKKIFIVLMVILALMIFPTMAMAADVPMEDVQEEVIVGDVKYSGELDTEEIIEIKYVGDDCGSLYSTYSTSVEPVGSLVKDTVLYVEDIIEIEENGLTTVWCRVKIDDSDNYYYIDIEQTKAISSVDSGYSAPVRTIKNSTNGQSSDSGNNNASGGSSGSYSITYYCSACNSPRGSNSVALSGSHAYVGSCASNSFPLGSTIYVEGYGTYFVNDRMGRSGVIDIYTGDKDTCTCSGRGRANAWIVG